jgi:excisionase family DNA binding protein
MSTAIEIAPEQKQILNRLLSSDDPLELALSESSDERVTLPEGIKPLLRQILAELAEGRKVAVMAEDEEMTTQEAADYLKVSRGYMVKVIDHGEIPSRMVGNQRRVKVKDVLLYEKKMGRRVTPPVKMRDMSKDMKWLSQRRREYAGKWVAIYEDRLIASGDNAAEVYAEADSAGFPQTLVTFIEEALPQKKSMESSL